MTVAENLVTTVTGLFVLATSLAALAALNRPRRFPRFVRGMYRYWLSRFGKSRVFFVRAVKALYLGMIPLSLVLALLPWHAFGAIHPLLVLLPMASSFVVLLVGFLYATGPGSRPAVPWISIRELLDMTEEQLRREM
ncbi:hypothetical protein [Demequina aestuarii]|uniref:hypothetical protein n=1 Tax=Demequina aestuarii TaxID=327095 RepID=UPI00078090E2|nr:hypothetical protein [Demequina aestuarii]